MLSNPSMRYANATWLKGQRTLSMKLKWRNPLLTSSQTPSRITLKNLEFLRFHRAWVTPLKPKNQLYNLIFLMKMTMIFWETMKHFSMQVTMACHHCSLTTIKNPLNRNLDSPRMISRSSNNMCHSQQLRVWSTLWLFQREATTTSSCS